MSVDTAAAVTFPQKDQDFIYTQPGAHIGYGKRTQPSDMVKNWMSDEGGNYQIAKGGEENTAPAFSFGTGKRQDRKIPNFPGPAEKNVDIKNYAVGKGPGVKLEPHNLKKKDTKMNDPSATLGQGPASYNPKLPKGASHYTFGMNFTSDILSKDHINPVKKDGPGPGSYAMPSSFKIAPKKEKGTSWGKSKRENLAKKDNFPAPAAYFPKKDTETAVKYSFPQSGGKFDPKSGVMPTPGPGAYEVRKEKQEGPAKSMLGGPIQPIESAGLNVPGPGTYQSIPKYSVPGFKIVKPSFEPPGDDDRDENEIRDRVDYDGIGEKYTKGAKIGRGEREPLKQKFVTPAPDVYQVPSDFEKAKDKPKFHWGMKTAGVSNKNLDQPGPGEYEVDVIPNNQQNVAHVIGTGVRSNLGIGKAHLQPGPGDYETRQELGGAMVGIGTEVKQNRIKKTYAPGPGSYDLPTTVGHLPGYQKKGPQRKPMQSTMSVGSAADSRF